MTPAINQLNKLKIPYQIHRYQHDTENTHFGFEAAEKLNLNPEQVFKTLIIMLDDNPKKLAVTVLPVANQLNLKKTAQALNCKKVQLAETHLAQKTTGYLIGGISPIAQKKQLPTLIAQQALNWDVIYISGGKRGLDISIHANDLAKVTQGVFADLVE